MSLFADLRSDTVTKPTHSMREAMARADVGDDVYGEDPTVHALEVSVAELLGKQAALFVPSGTMANQIALLSHTQRGDEVITGEGSHCVLYESGAGAAWSGVQFAIAGRGGLFTADEAAEVIRPIEYHYPRTSLIVVENTHNRAGGRIFPQRDVFAVAELARSKKLALHLDGARIWNASTASGATPASLAAPFDTVSVCFSKGLGAPAGSAFCGDADVIMAARRLRKMLGGGMRQAGILAAGALYALTHHRERLAEDHVAARALAAEVRAADVKGAIVREVETNIINIEIPDTQAARVIEAAKRRGVLVGSMGQHRIRAVTHLGVQQDSVVPAGRALAEALIEAVAEAHAGRAERT